MLSKVWGMLSNKEPVIIFGTGSGAKQFTRKAKKKYYIEGYLDNDPTKHGVKFERLDVLPPKLVSRFNAKKIIIASDFFDQIFAQLSDDIVFKNYEIIFYRAVELPPSKLESLSKNIKNILSSALCLTPTIFINLLNKVLKFFDVALYHIYSLDNLSHLSKFEFRGENVEKVVGPRYIYRDKCESYVKLPPVKLLHLHETMIAIKSRAFTIGENHIAIEKMHTIGDDIAKYNRGRLIHHYRNRLALVNIEPGRRINRGIVINGYYDKNYYHWLVEILAQLQYLKELGKEYENIPILISEMAMKIESVFTFFSLFEIKNPVELIGSDENLSVRELVVISSPNRCCPRVLGPAFSQPSYTYYRKENILYLRNLVLSHIKLGEDAPRERLFFAPSMKHRQYNQPEILNILKKYGFKQFNPENKSLLEQAKSIYNAEIIVGPTGASWTNILFAREETSALCWMAEEWGHFSAFSNLAYIVGVDLDYLSYTAGTTDHVGLYSKSYRIDANQIESWVSKKVN